MKNRVHLRSLCNFFPKNRRGIISEFLPWLLIAVAVLVILMITIFILKGQGFSLIDKIKGIFGG
jgi:hypothetical protein